MVLLVKDEASKIRSSVKARHRKEKLSEKNDQFLNNIDEETGSGLLFYIRHNLKVFTTKDYFEYTMAFFIVANSIIYAISDYSHVDANGDLVSEGNNYNLAVEVSEPFFLGVFSLEMLMKMIGFGLFGKHGYFTDGWAILDFISVVIGFISLIPNVPNLNVIRTLRCFRTLKALKSFPTLKAVTNQVVSSIPKLSETIAIYLCSIFFFGILGLYLFVGPYLHARCRYTPYPVTLDYEIGWTNFTLYRCLNAPNFDLATDLPSLGKSSSPWAHPVDCFWPIDNGGLPHQFCSLSNDKEIIDANNYCADQRWCGSNYDAYGNYRFTDNKLALAENYFSDMFYGHSNFDNIFKAVVVTFITSTANNWSSIMQFCTDSITMYAPLFYITVLVITNFMLLSLMIATWECAVEIDEGHLAIPNYFDYSVRGVSVEDAEAFKQLEDVEEHVDDNNAMKENEDVQKHDARAAIVDNYQLNISMTGSEMSSKRKLLQTYSASDISNHISQLGPIYASYSHLFIENDVDGEWLHRLNEKEITDLLSEIGISKSLHRKKILSSFMKLLDEIPPSITNRSTEEKSEKVDSDEFVNPSRDPNSSLLQKLLKWHYPPAKRLVTNFWYEVIVIFACVGNLLCSISDTYPQSASVDNRLAQANFIIVMFFVFEITCKLFGYGLGRFLNDPFLLMDCIIVMVSVVDAFTFVPIGFCIMGRCTPRSTVDQSENVSTVQTSPLRGLRCIRMLFLLRYLPGVRMLLSRIAKSIQSTAIFFLLVAIFLYIMALVGTSLYANKFRFDDDGKVILEINSYEWVHARDRPRNNFDYFLRSCATVLQLLSLDNWTDIMDSIWRSQGPYHVIYPFCVIVIGTYMLLSLYIGKMVEDFTTTKNDVADEMQDLDDRIPPPKGSEGLVFSSNNQTEEIIDNNVDIEKGSAVQSEVKVLTKKTYYFPYISDVINHPGFEVATYIAVGISILTVVLDSPLADTNSSFNKTVKRIGDVMTLFFIGEATLKIAGLGPYRYFTDIWNIFDFATCASSVYGLFSGNNGAQALRSLRVIKAIRALRLLTTLKGLKIILDTISSSANEIISVSIFLILIWGIFASIAIQYLKGQLRECKGDLMGFISSNDTYMHLLQYPKSWDKFSTSEKAMFGPNSEIWGNGFGKYINSNIYSWPEYPLCSSNTAFSNFQLSSSKVSFPTSRQLCECWGGKWSKSNGQNFDNIVESLIVAFSVASTENWYNTMNLVTDSNGIDMQPIFDNNRLWIVAFIFFMIFGSFFPLNMYVGVICTAYSTNISASYTAAEEMKTPEEIEEGHRTFSLNILKKNIEMQQMEFDAEKLQLISSTSTFRAFFTTMIFLNTILLACTAFGESDESRFITQIGNAVFSGIFTVEAIIRIRDRGWSYFEKKSNILDLAIVVLCDVSDILAFTADINFSILKLARLFRMIKILKLLKFESVLKILRILIKIIPGFMNVNFLLVCIILIWAIIGNQLFALVAFQGSHDKYSNFRTIGSSILTLVKFLTGEGWVQFMYDLSERQPGCVESPLYNVNMCGFNDKVGCIPINGCGTRTIFPFLMTFQIFAVFTILNLTISVIVNAFHHEFHQKSVTVNKMYQRFCRGWLSYDPEMTCYMKPEVLERFVMDQENNPFAFPSSYSMKEIRERLSHLGITVIPGKGCLLEHVMLSLEFDYEVFEDRLDPIQVQDSISDPNTFGLLQVYYSKDIRTELLKSNQLRKLTKQRRLGVKLSTEIFRTFFDKFYTSRAFLRWKHGDRFFNNSRVAGIWPKQYFGLKKQFEPLDFFSAKLYDDLLFGGWKSKQDVRKEPLFLDILDPEYDNADNGQSFFDTPIMKNTCVTTTRGPGDTDNLLSYINIFNTSGEYLENVSPKTPNYMIAGRNGIESSFSTPQPDTPRDISQRSFTTPQTSKSRDASQHYTSQYDTRRDISQQDSSTPKVIYKRKKGTK